MSDSSNPRGDKLANRRTELAVDRTELAAGRTELAATRTELAVERTLMAADRTLLAWTRTALALISVGFTLYKVLKLGLPAISDVPIDISGPRRLAIMLVSLGVVFLCLSCVQFRSEVRQLRKGARFAHWRLPYAIALMLALIGLLALARLIWQVGPF